MGALLIVDQTAIEAPDFPRPLEWWQRYVPCWITPALDAQGRVVMEPSGLLANGRRLEVTAARRRRALAAYRRCLLENRYLAPAVLPLGGAA
jgi:hypothetical protein